MTDTVTAATSRPAQEPPGQAEKRQQLTQLEALAAQGVPGLEPTIEAMRLELLTPPPTGSADWVGLRELLIQPGALESATDEELRAVVLELVDQVLYVGDPGRVEIRLRGLPGRDSE